MIYDVFRFTDRGHWDLVGEEIEAADEWLAIIECDQHALDGEQYGKFMVTRRDYTRVIRREQTSDGDQWS